MYFKRLELFGFKSFADRTKLRFEPGVTAVVGPNGCGKSNISDSIKWVLGEQSAKELRGARMEDVIFNGTSTKEPINMAEVSLVLSNVDRVLPIDFDEVTITRRLYRSGESEYLVNKAPVRLKDIHDLLAGTGMGQSSYSMIEQGRIGLILSSKPEERRYLFEEAAGITKYKAKKREALKKLEHTENNLLRINDIITEVQRQINSIERQARKAEKYKADFEVLKDLEMKLSTYQYRDVISELKTISIEHEDLKKRESELSQNYMAMGEEVRRAKDAIDALNDRIQAAQKQISENDAAIDKNTHTMVVDRERVDELKALLDTLNREIEQLKDKHNSKKISLERYEAELNGIAAQKAEKEALVKKCEEDLTAILSGLEGLQRSIKDNKLRTVDIMAQQTKIKNELIKMGAEMQSRKTRLLRLKVERENISREKTEFDNKMQEFDGRYGAARENVAVKKEQLGALKSGMNALESSMGEIRKTISDKKTEQDVLKSRQDMLNELVENQEGFTSSVKMIMEKSKQSQLNVEVKPVADVISIEQGMERAVESVLGEMINAMLVRSRSDAKDLSVLLRNENSGRAHFIVLEDAAEPSAKENVEGCRPILDFIKCPDDYRKAVEYLFRNTYVAGSSDVADQLFRTSGDARFVTAEGYLRQGPDICDGALIEADTSVIGRRERISELESTILSLKASLEQEAAREASTQEQIRDCKTNMERAESELRDAEIALANLDSERQALIDNMKRVSDECTVLDAEVYEEQNAIEGIIKSGEGLNAQLNEHEAESSRVQNEIFREEEELKRSAQSREDLTLKIVDIKGELSNVQVNYDNVMSNLSLRKDECSEIEKELDSKSGQCKGAIQRIEELQNEVLQLEADKQALQENKEHLAREWEALLQEKGRAVAEFNEKELALKAQEFEIDSIRNSIRDIDVKSSEIGYKKTSLTERIQQVYKEDLSQLSVEIEDGVNWDEVKEKITELKERLDRLGPVNLVAIEEHKELQERALFLTKQRDDLVNAKEALHKAIVKINATTRQLFIETFEKIKVQFRDYYRMLFGGGQAEVYLMDERDVLESGIEIVVRPPGKKLQNILLLSGGEKALTAIALMFAIFKINPSPFCVMDEIDAPLDETNIDRFTRVLQEFLKTSQFIIITHNKKTIQMADVLYGITMAERGVSKIVSVKFADSKTTDQPVNDKEDKQEVQV